MKKTNKGLSHQSKYTGKPPMRTLLCVICAIILSACGTPFAPNKLELPAASLLKPPPKIPEVKEGDDLLAKHVELRRQYITVADKYARLQRYVKTIHGIQGR